MKKDEEKKFYKMATRHKEKVQTATACLELECNQVNPFLMLKSNFLARTFPNVMSGLEAFLLCSPKFD
jgi:hypothetical protein